MIRSLSVAITLVLLASPALAKKPAGKHGADKRSKDEQAVRAVVDALKGAINREDAEAAAALFAPDGDWINPAGQLVKGREAIRREMELHFAEIDRGELAASPLQMRFLGSDVAVIDGTSRDVPEPPGPPADHRHTVIFVKQDGRWQIAAIRAAISFPASHYEHLKDLEWLVGSWRYRRKTPEPEAIDSTWKWADNKNFLVHEFTVRVNNQVVAWGTARVGWDPVAQKIKSWLFESDGTVLEATWSRDGDRWLIHRKGALASGVRIESVDVMTRVDADTFRFESTSRVAEGVAAPDREPVVMKRVEPRKRAKALRK